MSRLDDLTGDELTRELDRRNQTHWNDLKADTAATKAQGRILVAIVLVMLASQLTGFHVVPDPTIHLMLPWP